MPEDTARPSPRDVIAARLVVWRRGNPHMGGPQPQDYDEADLLIFALCVDVVEQ